MELFPSKVIKYMSNLLLEVLSFCMILFYRMFGAKENRTLFRNRVQHQIVRVFRLLSYKLFGKIPGITTLRLHKNNKLGELLHEVVRQSDMWWESRCKFMEPFAEYEEWMIAAVFSRNIVDVKYVGSTRETIGSLHYSETVTDVDMMYIYKDFALSEKPSSNHHIQIINSKIPGYVALKVHCSKNEMVSVYREIARKGQFDESLHVFSLIDQFEKNVLLKVSLREICQFITSFTENEDIYLLRSDYFRYMHEIFNRARFTGWMHFKQQGPASKIVWNIAGLPQRLMLGCLDIVFAVHCKEWPSQANEWLVRERKYGYPKEQMIKEIKEYGFDIVPKSSYTKFEPSTSIFSWFDIKEFEVEENSHQIEWRLSFSVAELRLVQSWSSIQKCCYRILKTIRSDFLSGYGITSYAMKNIMFYLLEETDNAFWQANFLKIMSKILEKLITCCMNQHCPHYFISDNNLFASVESKNLEQAASKCKEIILNWYKAILLSDGLWFEINVRGYSTKFYELSSTSESCTTVHVAEKERIVADNFNGIFKLYYSFKVQKETMKYMTNSYISYNYNTEVVLSAISSYIYQKDLSKLTSSQKVIFTQICWSYIKCLRYHMTKIDKRCVCYPQHIYLQDSAEIEMLIGKVLRDYLLRDEISHNIAAVELLLQGKKEDALKLFQCLTIRASVEEMDDVTTSPIFLSFFDAPFLTILQDFNHKSWLFYCPLSLIYLIAHKNEEISTIDKTLTVTLLEKVADLWQNFPEHIPSIRRYKPIMMPLAKYMYKKLCAR